MSSGMTALELLTPTVGWSQASDTLQQVDQRLADKRAAAEAHRKQMESIKDPEQLTTAMRQHFLMTEEILALMLERRKLQQAQTATSGAPAGQGGGMPGGGMQGGGMMQHGRGMMQKEMGGRQGSGMQGGSTQGSGTQGGSMPGDPSAHSGMSGMPSSGAQSAPATPGGDMTQMMQRIAEHSAYMETLQDKAALAQEMLRHQKMLDQMLQLMQ